MIYIISVVLRAKKINGNKQAQVALLWLKKYLDINIYGIP